MPPIAGLVGRFSTMRACQELELIPWSRTFDLPVPWARMNP